MSNNKINGVLTIFFSNPEETITFSKELPRQDLKLINVKVHMTTGSVSLATHRLFVDLPFINSGSILSSFENNSRIPIPLGENAVTLFEPRDFIVAMERNMPSQFRVSVRDTDGALIPSAELVSVFLQFAYTSTK